MFLFYKMWASSALTAESVQVFAQSLFNARTHGSHNASRRDRVVHAVSCHIVRWLGYHTSILNLSHQLNEMKGMFTFLVNGLKSICIFKLFIWNCRLERWIWTRSLLCIWILLMYSSTHESFATRKIASLNISPLFLFLCHSFGRHDKRLVHRQKQHRSFYLEKIS